MLHRSNQMISRMIELLQLKNCTSSTQPHHNRNRCFVFQPKTWSPGCLLLSGTIVYWRTGYLRWFTISENEHLFRACLSEVAMYSYLNHTPLLFLVSFLEDGKLKRFWNVLFISTQEMGSSGQLRKKRKKLWQTQKKRWLYQVIIHLFSGTDLMIPFYKQFSGWYKCWLESSKTA